MRRSLVAVLLLLLAFPMPVVAAPPPCRDHLCQPPPAVGMGRLLQAGFETNSGVGNGNALEGGAALASGAGGTDTTSSVQKRTGGFSLAANNVASAAWAAVDFPFTATSNRSYFARAYVYLAQYDSQNIIAFRAGSTVIGSIQFTDATHLSYLYGNNSANTGTTAPALNEWHRLEIQLRIDTVTQANNLFEIKLDGSVLVTQTNFTQVSGLPTLLTLNFVAGNASATYTNYYDDIALNDDQGASQNTYPGDGGLVLLVPTADSARSAGWVGGAGGTTSLFDAVDNKPPVGVADTGTNTSQIRNATAEANGNYDATMTTYTAAGIAAGSTINVIDPLIATGAPVTTSSKQGTVGVVSNPTIANVALGAGGTAGAFWSGVTAGTYKTGWKISHGTITYGPSVTLGTAPVMRVTQVTSSTRIADVCFMGIYVDYTAPAATQVPYVNPMPLFLAQ